MLVIASGCQHS